MFFEGDEFRCALQLGMSAEAIDERLRCNAINSLAQANNAFSACEDIAARTLQVAARECAVSDNDLEVEDYCRDAYYCPDDLLPMGRRCDGSATCTDLSDESQCFDELGQDMLLCVDGRLLLPRDLCWSGCGSLLEPSLCTDNPSLFVCPDGTEMGLAGVCNRENDCPGGEDESMCLR